MKEKEFDDTLIVWEQALSHFKIPLTDTSIGKTARNIFKTLAQQQAQRVMVITGSSAQTQQPSTIKNENKRILSSSMAQMLEEWEMERDLSIEGKKRALLNNWAKGHQSGYRELFFVSSEALESDDSADNAFFDCDGILYLYLLNPTTFPAYLEKFAASEKFGGVIHDEVGSFGSKDELPAGFEQLNSRAYFGF